MTTAAAQSFFPNQSVHTESKKSKDAINEAMVVWLDVPIIAKIGLSKRGDGDDKKTLVTIFQVQKMPDTSWTTRSSSTSHAIELETTIIVNVVIGADC